MDPLLLMALMGGRGGSNNALMLLALSGALGGSGGLDTSKLMAQMFVGGVAGELLKVENYKETGNIAYLII